MTGDDCSLRGVALASILPNKGEFNYCQVVEQWLTRCSAVGSFKDLVPELLNLRFKKYFLSVTSIKETEIPGRAGPLVWEHSAATVHGIHQGTRDCSEDMLFSCFLNWAETISIRQPICHHLCQTIGVDIPPLLVPPESSNPRKAPSHSASPHSEGLLNPRGNAGPSPPGQHHGRQGMLQGTRLCQGAPAHHVGGW